MVTKHRQMSKGSPKQAPKKPVAHDANGPCRQGTMPVHLQQCAHCPLHRQPPAADADNGEIAAAEHHQPDGSSGTGPLVLTLGSAADRRSHCCCSCGVAAAHAPAMMSVLRGSRYLRPAQELLREAVSMGEAAEASAGGNDEAKKHGQFEASASALQEMYLQAATNCPFHGRDNDGDGVQTKLLSLLSELESRREHYFGELSRVSSSFEPALGAGAMAGYTSLMAQAMSRHFGNLRRAILRKLRLQAAAAARRPASTLREDEEGEDDEEEETALPVTEDMVNKVVRRKKQAAAARAEQVWRPLRGLPEDSVAVLRAWLLDHFLHPYPDDNEKLRLAVSTGLSRSQISNWFINARVRLWKPMIEEMYNDEFSEASASRDDISGGASFSS